jgi:hypothetical protein
MKPKYRSIVLGFAILFASPPVAQCQKTRLSERDRKAVIESVLNMALRDWGGRFERPSILDNCQTLSLHDDQVIFLSIVNIDPKSAPRIAGVHFELMTPKEIRAEVEVNQRRCYLAFDRFEDVGSKVVVTVAKHLDSQQCPKCILYHYVEAITYEFSKASGKWRGEYKGQYVQES